MAPTLFAQAFSFLSMCAVAAACVGGGLLYFQHVRLSRPPLGVFDMGDMGSSLVSLLLLPLLYLALPPLVLTVLLALLFLGSLYTGLSALMSKPLSWLIALVLLGSVAGTQLLLLHGWQDAGALHLILNDVVVWCMVIVAANINIQYGMRLSYVAWYALLLAGYDAFFMWVIPLTPLLAAHLTGLTFSLAFEIELGGHGFYLGIGDMLMFTLLACSAYKSYSLRGLRSTLVVIAIFGVLLPANVLPILLALLKVNSPAIPVQFTFGPAVFVAWLRLARNGPERTMHQWFQSRTLLANSRQASLLEER